MIEMRQIVKKYKEYYPNMDNPQSVLTREKHTIQYRFKELTLDPHFLELEETDWSEWIDVPTVVEEE